ncbi:MAG: MFS transporter [Firmicutes bacterium]|nr:MFS transporter [Bacillota bacterium]
MPDSSEPALVPAMQRPRFFYGWLIVGISGLALFFSGPGQTYSVSLFIDRWIADFGWSRSLLAALYSVATILAGLTMTAVGRLVDRYGSRLSLTLVAVLLGGACLFVSAVADLPMLFIGFMLIRLFGQGSLTLIPFSLVPQWFVRRTARAITIMTFGGMLSSAIFPYLNLIFIEAWSWRAAWRIWAVLLLTVLAPAAWRWVRHRPEEIGLLPDNARPLALADERRQDCDGGRERDPVGESSFSFGEVLRLPVFWLLLLISTIPPMVVTGAVFHHMSILGQNGLAPQTAALVFTVAAASSFPGTLLGGWLCERLPIRYAVALTLLVLGFSTGWLIVTTSLAAGVILGVTRGLATALQATSSGVIWPAYFGRRNLGSIRGVTTTAMVLGSALGPLPFALSYDRAGSYFPVVLAMTAVCLLGAGLAALLRPPQSRQASLR